MSELESAKVSVAREGTRSNGSPFRQQHLFLGTLETIQSCCNGSVDGSRCYLLEMEAIRAISRNSTGRPYEQAAI